ncbi:MAG: hypothetical protein Q8R74_11005 [Methylophilus sp.]|nr:hypothetical protein [Methylophilus sp.]MDP3609591.1 hypothetical protein [Methylophilus sp.]
MRSYIYLVSVLISSIWSLQAFADWPTLPFPEHSRVETIGENVKLNGVPMQMHRILTKAQPEKIQQFYQRYLGNHHTKTVLNNGILLAQGRAQHFITIRISTVANGVSETLITVSDVVAAKANQQKPLGIVLPAQSQLLSDMESHDQGKAARQLVYENPHSVQTNIAFLVDVLQQRGYQLQPSTTKPTLRDQSIYFGGKNREARLVVVEKAQGSSVMLTTVLDQP